ncbi:ribonucleotide reductase large subunit [Orpheovirus IHUMI-LCC2]|uniref:Ribonucleoside-diphosphate reductase n=1 Tax=Orpheovirus IHUMI-LCC2 TaxID=2023057 RepID=A0A2I2L631_9VIRU|nr:ribonucleotide reductase large subunit [Orpheovirus IHUMI-LCC2]SNW63008.1 Ribonucleoside-diphosphate reductase large subunit [Orpheovirus IHUMI-LCC2]
MDANGYLSQDIQKLGNDLSDYRNVREAGKLFIQELKKNAAKSLNEYNNKMKLRLRKDIHEFLTQHENELQSLITEHSINDLKYDYFGANTLGKLYLSSVKKGEQPIETPQLMHMRVAVELYHDKGIDKVVRAYKEMSNMYYTHASPTLFNAGMHKNQMSSCFLGTTDDSLDSITDNNKRFAMISKEKGALGCDFSRVRHSEIGFDGVSSGVPAMLQTYNSTAGYVDQTGKRKGAMCAFLRPHHIDLFEFCELRLEKEPMYKRTPNLQTALWMPWLFYKRVLKGGNWTLFCPAKTPELNDLWGVEFEKRYMEYENDESISTKYRKVHKAEDILKHIIKCQEESSKPYILHADSSNIKSNQRGIGYIRCMNLCLEIVEFSDVDEIASCNLASLNLRKHSKGYVVQKDTDNEDEIAAELRDKYDFEGLGRCSKHLVENLNQVIDHNFYPLDPKGEELDKIRSLKKILKERLALSISLNKFDDVQECLKLLRTLKEHGPISLPNFIHQPIGIGCSGFAEMLFKLDLALWDGKKINPYTKLLNKMVFACIYYNALAESVQLSILNGEYASFRGYNLDKEKEVEKYLSNGEAHLEDYTRVVQPSPLSQGKLQFDLWKEEYDLLWGKNPKENPRRKASDDNPIPPSYWKQGVIQLVDKDGKVVDEIQPTWEDLRRVIVKYGVANSLLVALMPTASTSQIMMNTESVEMPTGNVYSRRMTTGTVNWINRYLVKDFKKLNIWNEKISQFIQTENGSVSKIERLIQKFPDWFPEFHQTAKEYDRLKYLVNKYRTMWEVKQSAILILAADRARYIDQSQSTNLYFEDVNYDKLYDAHILGFRLGLKTGFYYVHTKASYEIAKLSLSAEVKYALKMLDKEDAEKSKKTVHQRKPMPTNLREETVLKTSADDKVCLRSDPTCLACQ